MTTTTSARGTQESSTGQRFLKLKGCNSPRPDQAHDNACRIVGKFGGLAHGRTCGERERQCCDDSIAGACHVKDLLRDCRDGSDMPPFLEESHATLPPGDQDSAHSQPLMQLPPGFKQHTLIFAM